ncbi:TolB family protein [Neobacillus bataviensis]|uniref:TolB family protein n=1 Tax=Neobacillus bataviensis TaxID=220685 RepID=UPI001CBF064B|nr:TolB domain-containing protein [Neobacillus bataviensis]
MKKYFWILIVLILLVPNMAHAAPIENKVKVAFYRDGFVWLKMNGKETRITKEPSEHSYQPQWSHDGKWILYQIEPRKKPNSNADSHSEIWIYNVDTKKHIRITNDGTNPKWSPVENIVAFKNGWVLNVSNLEHFYNIALGVGDYNWYPDGRSFITASSASLRPDGWTNPILFKIGLEKDLAKMTSFTKNVKQLFTIPNELKKGNVNMVASHPWDFHFSSDGYWVSFIVSPPTASWAMDSNMVCVIGADGQNFAVLDETINEGNSPKWAYSQNLLGYIAGGGRIVLGFKNKDMKITEMPVFKSTTLTPAHFAEMGFTWKDDNSLYVSRVKETDWSNEAKKRPDPSLFMIKIKEQTQSQITHPPKDFGDYQPQFIPEANKLTWLRKRDIADFHKQDLWISDSNGQNEKLWIKNIQTYDFFAEKK